MTRSLFLALLAPSVALLACRAGDRMPTVDTTAVRADTAAVGSDSAHRVAVNGDMSHPESALFDPDLQVWWVSNINGDPSAHDHNGFISRLHADGTTDSLHFIQSGRNAVTLDGPKGMALQGDTLWVADINQVRAFDRRTGRPIRSVAAPGALFLNDVAVGPDGAVYITDTGMKGGKLPGPFRIYRIGADHKATVAIQDTALAGPNGIAWDAGRHAFVVVPMGGTTVISWEPGSKTVSPIATGPSQQDGVVILRDGRILATSWTDSTVFVVGDSSKGTLIAGVPSPADMGLDSAGNRLAIPLLMENRVEFWQLPAH